MKEKFQQPDFSNGELEFKVNDEEVCIYGTPGGLRWLAQKCLVLVDKNKPTHLHLEEYQVLTKESKQASLILFTK